MSLNMRSVMPFKILLSAVAMFALAACKDEVAKAPEPVRPVKVVTVTKGADTRPITYSGSIKPRIEQTLSFRVSGKITARAVNIGDRVEPGQLLARLDSTDLALSWRTSDANVEAARSRRDVAVDAYDRNKALFDKGFIAKSALDQHALELDQAKAAYDAAVFSRDQALNQKNYSDLTAEVAGIVTDVRSDLGQVVSAGTPVIIIAPLADREVAISVPEQDIRFFHAGSTVTTRYWADPTLAQTGTVREISGSADPQSRTFAVRISIPEDNRVRLGQTATVTIDVPVGDASLVVPLTALDQRNTSTVVWVADSTTMTVHPHSVVIDGVSADGVRVASGIATGDRVVVAGTQFLDDGKRVTLLADPVKTADMH